MQAIISKELHAKSGSLPPIGLLLVGICVWFTTPTQIHQLSSMNALPHLVAAGAAGFAVLLGAVQSWFDFSDRQRVDSCFIDPSLETGSSTEKWLPRLLFMRLPLLVLWPVETCWFS